MIIALLTVSGEPVVLKLFEKHALKQWQIEASNNEMLDAQHHSLKMTNYEVYDSQNDPLGLNALFSRRFCCVIEFPHSPFGSFNSLSHHMTILNELLRDALVAQVI